MNNHYLVGGLIRLLYPQDYFKLNGDFILNPKESVDEVEEND